MEKEWTSRTEELKEQTIKQIPYINEVLINLYGPEIPQILDKNVRWISLEEEKELMKDTGDTPGVSSVFAYGSEIYFVKESLQDRISRSKDLPFQFDIPLFLTTHALVSENLHYSSKRVKAGPTAVKIGQLAWSKVSKVNQSYFEIDSKITEGVIGMVKGFGIALGTEEEQLWNIGMQVDGDMVDTMTSIAVARVMQMQNQPELLESKNVAELIFAMNVNNRSYFNPENSVLRFNACQKVILDPRIGRDVTRSYFSGHLYEDYAFGLSDIEKTNLGCNLASGQTEYVLDILLPAPEIFRIMI